MTHARMAVLSASLLALTACQPDDRAAVTNARSAGGLAYDLAGEGPLVVLIHGSNLDRRMWREDVAWLQEHATVLVLDLRGQGASDSPAESYSNHRDLIALLNELGRDEATLLGLSAGVQVALDVALEAPDRVRRMVLVSPSLMGYVPEEMPPFFADLGAALRAGDFGRASDVLLAAPIMAVPGDHEDLVRTMVVENERLWSIPYSLVQQASPPAIDRLEEIEIPAMVLVGDQDLEAIRAQGILLEQRLADAQMVTIPGGGHLLNMTSPDAFRHAVSAFLGFEEE